MVTVISLLVFWIYTTQSDGNANDAPVIGVLTLACDEDLPNCAMENATFNAKTYLPASYVKFLEGGGAKVIPLLSDTNQDTMRNIISQVNGVLFTGGDATFSSNHYYWNQILNILSFIREYHNNHQIGRLSIPVWGTCLGLEAMVCETAKEGVNIMNTNITANYIALPLNYTKNAITSRIFNSTMDVDYSNDVYIALEENSITFNEHYNGFTPDVFQSDPYLSTNYTILSTSVDIYNVTFVSLIESLDDTGLYWYASQFHPEKPNYEFARNIPKSLNASYSNQYFAEFFVNECRLRNNNKMDRNLYDRSNIYNYQPYNTAIQSDNEYQQMYIFPAAT